MRRGLKSQKADLRTFLAEHRAVVTPAMAGLPANGLPRRVPGLRRDEIARLLGVATDYYTDLEKGLLPSAPETSLQDLLSDVLALSPADRRRLGLLLNAAYPDASAVTQQAAVAPPVQQPSASGAGRMAGHGGAVSAPTRQLLDSFDMPAYLRSRSLDLVAVNRPARLLYAPVLEWAGTQKKTVNLLEFAFFDQEAAQSFWPDWGDVITRGGGPARGASGVPGRSRPHRRRRYVERPQPPVLQAVDRPGPAAALLPGRGEDLPLPHRRCHGPLPHAR